MAAPVAPVTPAAQASDGALRRAEADRRYWQRMVACTALLGGIWFGVTLIGPWFARDVQSWTFWGFPFNFWMAAQGALFVNIVLIVFYVWASERLEDAAREAAGLPPSDEVAVDAAQAMDSRA